MPTYLASLNRALHELCESDPSIYVLGEDILDPYGGAFKVTRGLSTAFPERVITTPVSEAAIVGMAGGMALRGLRPIVEIMFGDFVLLGADQLVNHVSKYGTMYGRRIPVSLVIRTPMGAGRGYGPTHSQSLEKLLLGIPQLRVIAPSRFHDPGELLIQSVRADAPTLFIEGKVLYGTETVTPRSALAPLRVDWLGDSRFPVAWLANYPVDDVPDVVVITYGSVSAGLEDILRKLGDDEISVGCALPSHIDQIDTDLLLGLARLARYGILVCEEGTSGFGWGSEVVSRLASHRGTPLTMRTISTLPSVIPAARTLESVVVLNAESIEAAILDVVASGMAAES